jgi:murein DD-endopeptidase MepM/ murein hydrolase activator NlpD
MNIHFIGQALLQIFGLMYAAIRHESRMPCPSSYKCKADYILPFEGTWVVVNGGVTEEFSHSWDIYNQRFAYDFVILDEHGKTHHKELTNPQNYYCYGLKILAPANGTVVHIENRCDDSRIDGKKAYCDSRHIAGNHIVIKHADDEFSFLAHLKKGSIVVKKGDVVTQGQHIASCGNTGNSSEPHLHFQLQNSKSFFTSVGLPIEFKNVSARLIENYNKLDPRPTPNAVMNISGKTYLSRGFEVANRV